MQLKYLLKGTQIWQLSLQDILSTLVIHSGSILHYTDYTHFMKVSIMITRRFEVFLRSHHRCRWILDPRHIRKSEMLAAWHVTMYPSSNMLQCGNEPQIWRQNNIFLQRCACPPSCLFQRASGIFTEYWPTFSFLIFDVRMCTTIHTKPNPITQALFSSDKISACSCFKQIPFPKCCTDCPTMAEKGYTGLSFADDQVVSGSHVHGKFS